MRICVVLLFVGISWLGWAGTPPPSQTEIPNWFFHPEFNEYVGVSIPSEDASVRWNSALVSAMVSYEAHKAHRRDVSSATMQSRDTFEEHRMSQSSVKDTVSYRILRQFVNRNGELFLALEIRPGREVVQLDFEEQQHLYRAKGVSSYQHKGVVKWKSGEVCYLLNYASGAGTTECVVTLHGASRSTSAVRVRPMQYGTTELNSTEQFGWQYDASPSLHVAYMQAMCMLTANGVIFHGPVSLVDNRLIIHCPVYQTANYE